MLKKEGESATTLKDLVDAKGGLVGICGSRDHCNNCGTSNNDSSLEARSNDWYQYDF